MVSGKPFLVPAVGRFESLLASQQQPAHFPAPLLRCGRDAPGAWGDAGACRARNERSCTTSQELALLHGSDH